MVRVLSTMKKKETFQLKTSQRVIERLRCEQIALIVGPA